MRSRGGWRRCRTGRSRRPEWGRAIWRSPGSGNVSAGLPAKALQGGLVNTYLNARAVRQVLRLEAQIPRCQFLVGRDELRYLPFDKLEG